MQIFLRILKETGIAIVALCLVALVVWLLFQNQLPFLGKTIPDPIEYAGINNSDFDIEGDIEDETNPTETHTVTQEQSQGFEADRYVSTGVINPFSTSTAESDVPSERVTIVNSANGEVTEVVSGDTVTETDSGVKSFE